MAITANRYYNDPGVGQAMTNLASIFAPPSGAELAGYTAARAKGEEAARLAQMFDYTQSPEFDQTTFDRMGQASGQWNPSNGYYGVDTAAATSRANNAADNTRALTAQGMADSAAMARQMAQPVVVSAGQTAFMPGQTQAATGLGDQLIGTIMAAPGETAYLPDGRTLTGAPKPMSETEVRGAILQGLPQEDQNAALTGDIPVETIIQDGLPTIVRRSDAVGQQPAPSATSVETQNYQTPDGQRGTARFDNVRNLWVDTATNAPLPQGAITFNSSLQGGAAETGLAPTTANNTLANNQAAEITRTLNTLDLYEALIDNNPGSIGLPGLIRGTAQNAIATAQDLAGSFGKTAPEVADAAAEIRAGLQSIAPEIFDPSIPEAQFLQGTLAYAIARTENPSGEVSRQAYDRALSRISGGMLSNSQSVKATINSYRKVLQGQQKGVDVLRDPSTARTDTGFQTPPAAGGADVDALLEKYRTK